MTKARRAIAEAISSQDVILEVLDARMPASSENPLVRQLRRDKPCIKILSKSDLADPTVTTCWLKHFERSHPTSADSPSGGQVVAITSSTDGHCDAKTRIAELCKLLARAPRGPGKTVRAMIVGIPNVGKSTLINTLMGRSVANVGDEPAVTRGQQQVTLKNGMTILDNPGLMWPKIEVASVSLRLALGGAIPDTAIDYESVAKFGAELLLGRYPQLIKARYKLADLPISAEELLLEIGRRRGCLRAGGVIDLHKASDIFIHEFRTGVLGRISLEAPHDAPEPVVELEPANEPTSQTPYTGRSSRR
jgi:ribosome biogenesis GTPase A